MKATDKQKKLMTKLGLSYDQKTTKSEAQSLIEMEYDMLEQEADTQYHMMNDYDIINDFHFSSDEEF